MVHYGGAPGRGGAVGISSVMSSPVRHLTNNEAASPHFSTYHRSTCTCTTTGRQKAQNIVFSVISPNWPHCPPINQLNHRSELIYVPGVVYFSGPKQRKTKGSMRPIQCLRRRRMSSVPNYDTSITLWRWHSQTWPIVWHGDASERERVRVCIIVRKGTVTAVWCDNDVSWLFKWKFES